MATMMKCGHAANAVRESDQAPVCVICYGIVAGADEPVQEVDRPNLEGRTATCGYGGHRPVPSDTNLPFFRHLPDRETDEYYCGCYGWD